jgi:Tfp pilus assembly protein PilF
VLQRDVLNAVEKSRGPTHPDTLTARLNLGLCHVKRKAMDEAERLFREVIADGKGRPQGEWVILNAKSELGRRLVDREQYAEAEEYLLESFRTGSQQPDANTPDRRKRLHATASALEQLYRKWNRPADATPWQAEVKKWEPVVPTDPAQ